jgi:hypothetical protein
MLSRTSRTTLWINISHGQNDPNSRHFSNETIGIVDSRMLDGLSLDKECNDARSDPVARFG